ncbi:hypothetical protein PN462_06245 [Spirulina sp. CS-785/01]|uniref:hypothetical protein n=1 Tax=Spirulina sp. CS-785/01 TaxID=3021716 RepID=UPI00232AAEEF|nr:hypothetical protein [Spirulina sp. CS-785/01]MDB9312694.1 hypothetical protein [Spirulina sp. CS-785/01]
MTYPLQHFIQRTVFWGLTALFPVMSLMVTSPSLALNLWSDRYRNEFDSEAFRACAEELLNTEIDEDQVAIACSEALEPKDLSFCVDEIDYFTTIDPLYALFACFRVRRPIELANCVVDIHYDVLVKEVRDENTRINNINEDFTNAEQKALDPISLTTLDHCRRSLLPERFSACVVGLTQEIPLSSERALDTCIRADDFPREIYTPSRNSTLEPENF